MSAAAPSAGAMADEQLLPRLLAGDEDAFCALVRRHHATLVRLAATLVPGPEAEEVAQEAWLAVIAGLANFARRSTLRTWIIGILLNKARSCARTNRNRSLSVLDEDGPDSGHAAVDPARFRGADDPFAGYWWSAPVAWGLPEYELGKKELRQLVWTALRALPARQQQVVVLRDLEGLSADEVCVALDVSPGNQRVLLHRGRSQLRAVLEAQFGGRP